jgi:D-alanyl-D-alanine carboxypeptidase
MRIALILKLLLFLLIPACVSSSDNADIYGKINPDDYVTGRFNPAKHELFVLLSDLGIPTNKWPHRLRREAAEALKELYIAFRKDNPKAPFWVQSSTRSFEDQRYIWEGKWTGNIKVNGLSLAQSIRDPLKRAVEILKFSSMPGTSRHHWGTDFDLNVLSDDYFEKGEGKELYRWMRQNAHRYGFCQPYTAGRNAGYREEKWHWSYVPLAKIFLARWNHMYRKNPGFFVRRGLFRGAVQSGSFASEYMNSINAVCK